MKISSKILRYVTFGCLYILFITTNAQTVRRVISTTSYPLEQKWLLENRIMTNTRGVSMSIDASIGVAYTPTNVVVFDITGNNVITELEQKNIVGVGFVDNSTIGIVSSSNRKDSIKLYNFVLDRLVFSSQLPSPQTQTVKMYHVIPDSSVFYICSMNEAITWTFNKATNKIIKQETNLIYSEHSGDVLKHLYEGVNDASSGIMRLKDNIVMKNSMLQPKVTPTVQSFNASGDRLLIADGYSGTSKEPDVFIYNTETKQRQLSIKTGNLVLFCGFLSNAVFMTMEMNMLTKSSEIKLRSLHGNLLSTLEASEKRIGSIQLSRDKKSLLYLNHPEGEIYFVRLVE